MAMTIFFVLNGVGIVFLVYVLASFWKEGHRTPGNARKAASKIRQRDWPEVFVVTRPISLSAEDCFSVIPFRVRDRSNERPAHGTASRKTTEASERRISTRQAKSAPGLRDYDTSIVVKEGRRC
jgi:hypothetical protein